MGARGLALAVCNIQSTTTLATQCVRKYISVRSRPEPCQRLGWVANNFFRMICMSHAKISKRWRRKCIHAQDSRSRVTVCKTRTEEASQQLSQRARSVATAVAEGPKRHKRLFRRGPEASQQLSQRGRSVTTAVAEGPKRHKRLFRRGPEASQQPVDARRTASRRCKVPFTPCRSRLCRGAPLASTKMDH